MRNLLCSLVAPSDTTRELLMPGERLGQRRVARLSSRVLAPTCCVVLEVLWCWLPMTSSRRSLTLTCDFVLLILYIVHCSEQFGRFVMWPLSSLHSAATGTCCLSINADMVCNMLKRSSGKQHLITHKACCPVMCILALLWKSRKNLKLAWGRCLEPRKNRSVPVMCILSLIYIQVGRQPAKALRYSVA